MSTCDWFFIVWLSEEDKLFACKLWILIFKFWIVLLVTCYKKSTKVIPFACKPADVDIYIFLIEQLVTSFKPSEEDISCACKPVNVEKNRSMDIVPVNLKRVVLPARPGVEGSDYINATYLQVNTAYI